MHEPREVLEALSSSSLPLPHLVKICDTHQSDGLSTIRRVLPRLHSSTRSPAWRTPQEPVKSKQIWVSGGGGEAFCMNALLISCFPFYSAVNSHSLRLRSHASPKSKSFRSLMGVKSSSNLSTLAKEKGKEVTGEPVA